MDISMQLKINCSQDLYIGITIVKKNNSLGKK